MPVRVLTDSTCDLPADIVEEFGIVVVPLTVFFGDEAFLDGVELTSDEFFARLVESPALPRTSQPAAEAFKQAYEALAKETSEIVSIHVSAKLSGTLNSAMVAAGDIAHEGLRIEHVDSETTSLGLGLIVREAARVAKRGGTVEEVVAATRNAMARTKVYIQLDTLEYLQKGGRIGRARALLGSVLSFKPIVGVEDGEVVPVDRVRTRKKAVERVFELATADSGAKAVFATCTANQTEAEAFVARLAEALPNCEVRAAKLGPVVGVYLGPNALGVAILHGEPA